MMPAILRRRAIVVCATALACLAVAAPAASADDLLVLEGDQVVLGGSRTFGIVYIDGAVRLFTDTAISASTIYLGPNAQIISCHVPGNDTGCASGRNLALDSKGPLTISGGLDLTGGTGGASRPGGSLFLKGAEVTAGAIDTGGDAGPSGNVTIRSRGTVEIGAIRAPGAQVSIEGAGDVNVDGDIEIAGSAVTPQPDPFQYQSGGSASVVSILGAVAVRGAINAGGRDSAAAGVRGGGGGSATVRGTDVRVGGIDTTGGAATTATAGVPGPIVVVAKGALEALGRLDASGASASVPSPGRSVLATATGPALVAGGAAAAGGAGAVGGAPGGSVEITGATVVAGNLAVPGGAGTGTAAGGAAGGSVKVISAGRTSLGSIAAAGGAGTAGARGGGGGAVAVTGSMVSTGGVSTAGAGAPGLPGSSGGPISLSAGSALTVGGAVNASGAAGAGANNPPPGGGNGGYVLLRAGAGRLFLGGAARSEGGDGGPSSLGGAPGAPGGSGGNIDVVAASLGPVVAISSAGGAGGGTGNTQGIGGRGGQIHAWTDGPLFDDQKVVLADGGDGIVPGAPGGRVQELSPADLAVTATRLTFRGRSPGGQGFRVLRSIGAGPFEQVAVRLKDGAVPLSAPPCVATRYTVVAFHAPVGWTSPVPPPVAWTARPSARQACADAPRLTVRRRTAARKLASVRRAKWRVTLAVRSSGLGALSGKLLGKRKVLAVVKPVPLKAGAARLNLSLPRSARRAGRYRVQIQSVAPDGKKRFTTTITLELKR